VIRRERLISSKRTKTSIFLLPMLGINHRSLPKSFFNAYITKNDELVLVFDKTQKDEKFNIFLEYSNDNNDYIKYEEDVDEILMYFDIPIEFSNDYHLFLQGAYSKFSEEYKNVLILIHGRQSFKDSHLVSVFDAIQAQMFKRKQVATRLGVDVSLITEVFDRPEMDEEQFTPLIELLNQEENKQETIIYDNQQ
jgi:hypothetical protein